jgi:hypothetical protein
LDQIDHKNSFTLATSRAARVKLEIITNSLFSNYLDSNHCGFKLALCSAFALISSVLLRFVSQKFY